MVLWGHGKRVIPVSFSFDAIGDKIADRNPFVIPGKVNMCEKIHSVQFTKMEVNILLKSIFTLNF